MAAPTILVIATLDTKGHEVEYLRRQISQRGKRILVVDCGMGGVPVGEPPDIPRQEIARAAGSTYEQIEAMSRRDAEVVMARGMCRIVPSLYRDGKFQGVLALGGYDGTILASSGMRELPLGVPKLIVSAMACGEIRFGEFVGTKDITIMPSGVDLMGVNPITRRILDNAAGAICGMVDQPPAGEGSSRSLVAVTMFGQTTPCASMGKRLLEEKGYDIVAFHPNGVGGYLMEEMVEEGTFCAVWDLTTQDITAEIVQGKRGETIQRLRGGAKRRIPRVVAPGCMDFIWGSPEPGEWYTGRRSFHFNQSVVLGKLTAAEIKEAGALLVRRLNDLAGPVRVLLPNRGISMFDKEDSKFFDPDLDRVLFDVLERGLDSKIQVLEIDAHINDPAFAGACISALLEILTPAQGG